MVNIIDWKKIKDKDKVKLTGKKGLRSYRVGNKMVVWSSYEALRAQRFLDCKVKGKRVCSGGQY